MVSYGDQIISEPALELHNRAGTSVRGNITAQLILTQGKIPEEGRSERKKEKRKKESSRKIQVGEFSIVNKVDQINNK